MDSHSLPLLRSFYLDCPKDVQPKAENEELDHAIALSFAEDAKKRNDKFLHTPHPPKKNKEKKGMILKANSCGKSNFEHENSSIEVDSDVKLRQFLFYMVFPGKPIWL
ncbi:uncharacterized protein LOC103713090 isoform X9 [Phoenix dactylifera]|uniref:Uncharacterized protein LOC103713090 isoform X9 n=1 Tax=Phoenix dactylifera TaxID=42345 RepID=A0A8B9AWE4_PHODC|nr:uncharacterized protein LOC103713090 isoform X9 [Phoenix dactylifera]